jgi:hypothetical protein
MKAQTPGLRPYDRHSRYWLAAENNLNPDAEPFIQKIAWIGLKRQKRLITNR